MFWHAGDITSPHPCAEWKRGDVDFPKRSRITCFLSHEIPSPPLPLLFQLRQQLEKATAGVSASATVPQATLKREDYEAYLAAKHVLEKPGAYVFNVSKK